MTSNSTPLGELAGLLFQEGKRRILMIATAFSVIAIAALGIGLVVPKRYDAFALVAVGAGQGMKPLTEGRGMVAPGTPEHAAITLQILEGKKILRELLVFGGWEEEGKKVDPLEEAKLLQKLRSRIRIDAPKDGIVRISYNDNDPDRTYKMANKLAEVYVRESEEAQVRESKEAFEFIDKQVKEYSEKVSQYHQEVLAQYSGIKPAGTAPSAGAAVPRAPLAPGATISPAELAALRSEKITLEAQLAPKTAAGTPAQPAVDPTVAPAARVRQLQTELDGLLAKYTDQHPDVKRVKRDLAAAQEELARAEQAKAAAAAADRAAANNTAAMDNQLQAAARARLKEINQRIAAATGVPYVANPVATPRPNDPQQRDPELRNIGQDTKLSELVRRYEATRDVYQDLLRRRETARVAMEMSAEHRGPAVRIQEPAEFPVTATGLRLSHFCLVGFVLAAVVPIGVLFAIVKLDGRVRTASQIEVLAKVPLLVSISAVPDVAAKKKWNKQRLLAVLMLVGVVVIYAATFLLKTRNTS